MTYGVARPDYPDSGAAVVFGGSGGIGGGIAKLLAERGANISLTYNTNHAAADEVVQAIRALGRTAHCAQVELSDADAVHKYMDGVVELFGSVHSVVFATGPMVYLTNVRDLDVDDYWKFIEVDVRGVFNGVHSVIPHMRAGNGGAIVALGTIAQTRYLSGDVMSSSPKGAVVEIIRAVAHEEGEANIRANFIVVGCIEAGIALRTMVNKPGVVEGMVAQTPLRRIGQPEELAEAVSFLASSKSSFITGSTLTVDGGWTI